MINDLDEALRQLLIRELPIKNGEVDIAFDQPKREWSARLNRPTINLFLYDVRENAKLRQTRPMWDVERHDNGSFTKRRKPVRLDLHFMITAWANEPEDEHRLLTRTLLALFRTAELPPELLSDTLRMQPAPITIMAAQEDILRTPADLWSALDNELRPSIACTVTMALNPYETISGPLVRTRQLRSGQAEFPAYQEQFKETIEPPKTYWTIGGTIHTEQALDTLQLTLVERGITVPLQPEGRFAIGKLEAGDYTLEVSVEGRKKPQRHKITVPSPDYDLEV